MGLYRRARTAYTAFQQTLIERRKNLAGQPLRLKHSTRRLTLRAPSSRVLVPIKKICDRQVVKHGKVKHCNRADTLLAQFKRRVVVLGQTERDSDLFRLDAALQTQLFRAIANELIKCQVSSPYVSARPFLSYFCPRLVTPL